MEAMLNVLRNVCGTALIAERGSLAHKYDKSGFNVLSGSVRRYSRYDMPTSSLYTEYLVWILSREF